MLKLTIQVSTTVFFLLTGAVQAAIISTSIGDFELTKKTSTVDIALDEIQAQPWFGDRVLAEEFARATDCALVCDRIYHFLTILRVQDSVDEFGLDAVEGFQYYLWNGAFVYGPGLVDEFLDRSIPEFCDGNGFGLIGGCTPVTYVVAHPVTEPGTFSVLAGLLGLIVMSKRRKWLNKKAC